MAFCGECMQPDHFTFFLQNHLKELEWEGKATVEVGRQSKLLEEDFSSGDSAGSGGALPDSLGYRSVA